MAIISEGHGSGYKNSSWETKINSVSTAVLLSIEKWAAACRTRLGDASRGAATLVRPLSAAPASPCRCATKPSRDMMPFGGNIPSVGKPWGNLHEQAWQDVCISARAVFTPPAAGAGELCAEGRHSLTC